MEKIIPLKLKNLAKELKGKLYIVGGAVRDFIAGLRRSGRTDWDICAPVAAEEVALNAKKLGFEVIAEYKNTGTIKLACAGEEYEFTSFRTDSYKRGEHRPFEVKFTDDIRLDALRRDFKCNAVYYDVAANEFVDPLGGIADIKNRVLNTVTDSKKVFSEDGLRLMRLARQAAQTGFKPSEECLEGAKLNSALIRDVAAERVYTELDYILHADEKYGIEYAQYEGLKILHAAGVLKEILPELALGDGMPQREDFHKYDVLEHSLRCVKYAHSSIRLAALLHDVGKPYCYINTGKYTAHEEEGAKIAEKICRRLKVSNSLTRTTVALVRTHMYDINLNARENKIRKFIVDNYAIFGGILLLKQADYSACRDDLSVAPVILKWQKIKEDMENKGLPVTLNKLAVRGDELIFSGISPDEVGLTLKKLQLECIYGNLKNEKAALIERAVKGGGK